MGQSLALCGARIFDGARMVKGHALMINEGRVAALVPEAEVVGDRVDLAGGVLAPGFVDLQVNGGGGLLFNGNESVETLAKMAAAHARLGATSILPTLITDAPERARAAVDAVEAALAQGVNGVLGLHLEGPHLSVARKGAHDAEYIRAMGEEDLAFLLAARRRLPALKVTVAVESVTPEQIARLVAGGVLVSLGHSDATYAEAMAAVAAGAICATHLFNAMRQIGPRDPGLVGAAISEGRLWAGLIADGVHVHRANMALALRAKAGPGRVFLVSDAMAVAGSDSDRFTLNGREILRWDGRLTLADGTLAGADLDLPRAVRNLVGWGLASEAEALAMASALPAELIGAPRGVGRLLPGGPADLVHLAEEGDGLCVWQAGQELPAL